MRCTTGRGDLTRIKPVLHGSIGGWRVGSDWVRRFSNLTGRVTSFSNLAGRVGSGRVGPWGSPSRHFQNYYEKQIRQGRKYTYLVEYSRKSKFNLMSVCTEAWHIPCNRSRTRELGFDPISSELFSLRARLNGGKNEKKKRKAESTNSRVSWVR